MKHEANNKTFFLQARRFFGFSCFKFHVSGFMKKGVTMIELLVTMTMIAIISSVVFASRGSMEDKLALQRAAYQLSHSFREAAEMSMGSFEGSCGVKDICGFGLYFNTSDYGFFIDCAPSCSTSNHIKDGQDIELRRVPLEGNIEIATTSPNSLNVLFSPPDPIVYINGTEWNREGIVTLELDSETRNVRINSAGKIEIE